MKMKRSFFILTVFALLCNHLIAQNTADTLSIREVEINSTRTKLFSSGSKMYSVDSVSKAVYKTNNLSEYLSENTSAFIKSYGNGASSTISFRGTEARHTSVLWNGFNINSPTLGLSDFSLIPVSFSDEINITPGSESSLYGTSAIGGVIELRNVPDFFNGIKINYTGSIGSFHTYENALGVKASGKKISSSTKIIYLSSKNNFTFTDFAKNEKTQPHAEFKNGGLMQQLSFRFNNTAIISAFAWYQVTEREIPPLMTVAKSFAEQKDSILRFSLEFKKLFQHSAIHIRAAYFDEFQLYTDSFYNINSPYKVKSYRSETEYTIALGNLVLNSGVAFSHYRATANEYNENTAINYSAIFGGANYQLQNTWNFSVTLRKEITEKSTAPVTPSVGIEKKLAHQKIILKAKAGRNFNLPTLNDLYWIPGGNTQLHPETGWSYEAGIKACFLKKRNLEIELTGFSTLVNDWIQWQATAYGYYAPYNLKKVHARGIECHVNYEQQWRLVHFCISSNYAFTKSTNEKSAQLLGNEIIGKQLIYIPEHLANIIFRVSYDSYSFSCVNQFTGLRYTTFDNSSVLPSYFIADIRIEKSFPVKKNGLNTFIKINNLFNEQYQAIAYRAMPGRNYTAGISFQFEGASKNKDFKN